MSMELYLIFAMQDAPTLDQWNSALSEHKLPVSITEAVDLTSHSGFLPMRLEDAETGLYFLVEDYAELAAHFPSLREIPIVDPVVYSLGFGGRMDEGAAVFYSAYVLAVTFNGTALETQGGTVMPAEGLLEAAKLMQQMATNQ